MVLVTVYFVRYVQTVGQLSDGYIIIRSVTLESTFCNWSLPLGLFQVSLQNATLFPNGGSPSYFLHNRSIGEKQKVQFVSFVAGRNDDLSRASACPLLSCMYEYAKQAYIEHGAPRTRCTVVVEGKVLTAYVHNFMCILQF